MSWMISLAQLLLSLSFLVAVHEMGHLLAAKYFGMRVEQFSIGFPPKIWSFKKGETEYAISAIPLGGYVKISGMIDESLDTEAMKLPPQSWEFRSKPAGQRLIVMLGGIVVNLVVGVLIFIGLTYVYGTSYILKDEVNNHGGFHVGPIGESIGLKTGDKIIKINGKPYDYIEDLTKPQTLMESNGSYTIERNGEVKEIKFASDFLKNFNEKESALNFVTPRLESRIDTVAEKSIAAMAGLRKNDVIIEFNGHPIKYNDEVRDRVNEIVTNDKSKAFTFKIVRDGKIHAYKGNFGNQKLLGFAVNTDDFFKRAERKVSYSFFESIPMGAKRAFNTLATQVQAFGKVITGKLPVRDSLSGPLGIMKAFDPSWDWFKFWSLTGLLSLVLAFMNLLPIPALDGGHVAFLTYEIVSRRKPSDKFLENAQKVGMVLLLSLMVFVISNDVIKLFTKP